MALVRDGRREHEQWMPPKQFTQDLTLPLAGSRVRLAAAANTLLSGCCRIAFSLSRLIIPSLLVDSDCAAREGEFFVAA